MTDQPTCKTCFGNRTVSIHSKDGNFIEMTTCPTCHGKGKQPSPTSEREKIEKLYAYSKEAEWDQWQAAAELLLREAREQGYDKGWSIKGNTSNTDYDEVRREGLAELENSNG